jgi:hypothetical protein
MVSSTTASSHNSGGAQPGNPPHWTLLLLLAGLLLLSRSQEECQQILQVFLVLFQFFEALLVLSNLTSKIKIKILAILKRKTTQRKVSLPW